MAQKRDSRDNSWKFNLGSKSKSEKRYNFDLCRLGGFTSQKSESIVNRTLCMK